MKGKMCSGPKLTESAEQESEKKYRFLVDHTKEIVLILNKRGKIVFANKRTLAGFGYSEEELIGKSIAHFLKRSSIKKVLFVLAQEFLGRPQPEMEVQAKTKSGDIRYLSVAEGSTPIYENGKLAGVMISASDITERKKTEEDLKKRSDQLELIHHIQSEIPMNTDLETILIRAAESIGKSFGYYKISVNLYDPETGEIEYLTGWNRTGLPLPRGHRQKLGQGLIGKAGLRKQTIVANDVFKEPDFIPYHLTETKAELIIPLLVQDKLIGVLDLQAPQVNAFSKEDVSVLQAVANYISYIIDEKQKEEALRDSETRLKEAQELGRIGSWEFDLNNRTIHWSDQVYRLYERDPALGPPSAEEEAAYYSHEQAEILRKYARIAAEQGRVFEYGLEARLPSGRTAYLAATMRPVKDKDGHIVKLFGTVQDITERKMAEQALKESEEKYRALFECANDAVFLLNSKGKHVMVNKKAADMLGYSIEELRDLSYKDVVAPSELPHAQDKLRDILEGKTFPLYERLFRKKDGTKFPVEINISLIRDKEGRASYLQSIVRDITERKRVENELHQTSLKLQQALGNIIDVVTSMVELKDPYTAGHQKRVAALARAIAMEMGLSLDQIDGIRVAGTIHDIGKIFIPGEILSKPGKLNEYEYSLIKGHSQAGYEILKEIKFPWPIAQIIHQHHERMDGSGHPQGLSGQSIILEARILAVADVVEAMSSHRPYRPAFGFEAALEEILQKRGILYDPDVVDACIKLHSENRLKFE